MTTTAEPEEPLDVDSGGEIEQEPDDSLPPPREWVDRHFPDDTEDIDEDTHEDVPEVDTTP